MEDSKTTKKTNLLVLRSKEERCCKTKRSQSWGKDNRKKNKNKYDALSTVQREQFGY